MSTKFENIGKCGTLALLSQIPVVSAFSKFCEDFVHSSWQERIDAWQKEVVKQFSELDTDMEQKIRETSNFASLLASTQRAALEDPEEDKLSLYVSSVINAIKNEKFTDVKKHIFLNFLRDFSLLHIQVLQFISTEDKPRIDVRPNGLYVHTDLHRNLHRQFKDKDTVKVIISDLANRMLIYTVSNDREKPTEITDLGLEFLNFIMEQEKRNV